MKPLLAAKYDASKIKFPAMMSPKLDGIRCLTVGWGAVSRKLKPIPNEHIRSTLAGIYGLDGELMVRGDFNDVQSAVMSHQGKPDFVYRVFDTFDNSHLPFEVRTRIAHDTVDAINVPYLEYVPHITVESVQDVKDVHAEYMSQGHEGSMLRCPQGIYKFGRSTVNQGILLKLKDWLDNEAEILEITERMHNTNELKRDALGYAERSNTKHDKAHTGIAGGVTVRWQGKIFDLGFGEGFDDEEKRICWTRRATYKGLTCNFKYQGVSKDGIPRFGKFTGIRYD